MMNSQSTSKRSFLSLLLLVPAGAAAPFLSHAVESANSAFPENPPGTYVNTINMEFIILIQTLDSGL